MTPLRLNSELLEVARRVIWFEEAEQALSDSIRFIIYAMNYATYGDMQVIRRYVSDDALRESSQRASPGIIDPRSWAYWHLKLGQFPAPEMPVRSLK